MSDFLFPTPDVAYAAGQVLDLLGVPQQYNSTPTEAIADATAHEQDWVAVGMDLVVAMDRFAQSLQ